MRRCRESSKKPCAFASLCLEYNKTGYVKIYTSILLLFPFLGFAQSVSVTFQVNMNHQISQGRFSDNDPLDVAGTFNAWGTTIDRLTDADDDGIYSTTISDFSVGDNIEFKFRRQGNWNGSEEFPGGGPNRRYTVQSADNEILAWYNDELPNDAAPVANLRASDTRLMSGSTIYFQDISAGNVTLREWLFQGGTPSRSTNAEVAVEYDVAGKYDVALVVGNGEANDTLLLEDYIQIDVRDRSEVEWWNDAVFYEIFVRSFYDSDGDGIGDFDGLTSQLDYLNDGDPNTTDDLGVTGIWLMPIHDSPSYHGYDVRDYRSIEPDYGTMEDFQEFLAAAHERGIRVIIDYVMNHTSHAHPWFLDAVANQNGDYRNWYRWSNTNPSYNGPWGQQVWHYKPTGYFYGLFWSGMPDLNYEEPAVQAEMFDIADYWLEEIGVDGFRLDAVKFIYEDGRRMEDIDATFQFWKDFRAHYKETRSDAFSVGEAWTGTSIARKYVEDEALDFCFEFELSGNIINAVNRGNVRDLSFALQRVYNTYPHNQWGTFLSNHDQNRIFETFGENQNKMKTAASILLTLPGIPFVYYGEEIGMKGVKPDEYIRTPMQWTGGANAGFSTASPWIAPNSNYTSFNVENQVSDENSILNTYKNLIHTRNEEVALRRGDYQPVSSSTQRVLAFTREYEGETILVLINTSPQAANSITLDVSETQLDARTYAVQELLSDTNESLEVTMNKTIVGASVGAYQTKIYKFAGLTPVKNIQEATHWTLYPNPASDIVQIETQAGTHYTLSNLLGQELLKGTFIHKQSQLDITHLPKGNYMLHCVNGALQRTFQLSAN